MLVYCIDISPPDGGVGGSDWFYKESNRDERVRYFEKHGVNVTPFTLDAPDDLDCNEITQYVDDVAWEKAYRVKARPMPDPS